MLAAVAGELTLEIIEGPGAGKQIRLDKPILIGRAADSDFVLEDGEVSRHHARVTPQPDATAVIEDLESANGTFINHNELIGPAHLDAGDELLLGVTVLKVRSREDLLSRPSAVIQIPPALAAAPHVATYVNPELIRTEAEQQQRLQEAASAGHPTVDKFLDVRVRRRTQLAPLALVVLIAIVLILVFSLK